MSTRFIKAAERAWGLHTGKADQAFLAGLCQQQVCGAKTMFRWKIIDAEATAYQLVARTISAMHNMRSAILDKGKNDCIQGIGRSKDPLHRQDKNQMEARCS